MPSPSQMPAAIAAGAFTADLEDADAVKIILATSAWPPDRSATSWATVTGECTGGTYARTSLPILAVEVDGEDVVVTASPTGVGRGVEVPAWVLLERADHLPLAYYPFTDVEGDPVMVEFPDGVAIDTSVAADFVKTVNGAEPDAAGNVYVSVTGIPDGGTTGQVLKKASSTDQDTEWASDSGGSGLPDPSGHTAEFLASDGTDALWVAPQSDTIPQPLGVAAAGTDTGLSRDDHVHQMPSAADVGAATASDITTAITTHAGATDPHGDRAYAAGLFAANDALVYKGVVDCSANPNYPAADAGHAYKVSVAGKIGGGSGVNVEVGDLLVCTVDSSASGNQATVGANWDIIQVNLDGAVIGPASAADSHVALFDGTSGRLIKDGGAFTPAGIGAVPTSRTVNGHALSADVVVSASDITTGTLPIGQVPTGTTGSTVPFGNDSRFSNARTPTAHKTSHASGGSDALTPADIGAASLVLATAVKTSAYSAAVGDYVPVDTSSGTVTVTLPTAPADGAVVAVKRIAGATNAVTVACGGSDVLNTSGGSTSATIGLLNQQLTFTYKATGAIWYVTTSNATSQLDTRYLGVSTLFGTGADGAATISSNTTITSDATNGFKNYTNLTINAGVTLTVVGIIYVSGTLTNNGTISAAGGAASGSTAGTGASGPWPTALTNNGGTGGTTTGPAGTPGSFGNPGSGGVYIFGGAGGTGGNGTSGFGGNSGDVYRPATGFLEVGMLSLPEVWMTGLIPNRNAVSNGASGAGRGGGAGSGDGTNTGGGGGGGGGYLVIRARHVAGSGTITAAGGAGGNPSAGNTGGGAGGGGGFLGLVTSDAAHSFTLVVTGGAAGTGHGTGTNSTAGSAGNTRILLGA